MIEEMEFMMRDDEIRESMKFFLALACSKYIQKNENIFLPLCWNVARLIDHFGYDINKLLDEIEEEIENEALSVAKEFEELKKAYERDKARERDKEGETG